VALIRRVPDGGQGPVHKVSLRSRGEVDVEKIARPSWRGGHRKGRGVHPAWGRARRSAVGGVRELGDALQLMTERKERHAVLDKEPGFTSHDRAEGAADPAPEEDGSAARYDPDAHGPPPVTWGRDPDHPLPETGPQGL